MQFKHSFSNWFTTFMYRLLIYSTRKKKSQTIAATLSEMQNESYESVTLPFLKIKVILHRNSVGREENDFLVILHVSIKKRKVSENFL